MRSPALPAKPSRPNGSDETIRALLLAELAKEPWAPVALINPVVRDGVVELWGTITDERERPALVVAAENVPGVKAVHDHLAWVDATSGMVFYPPEDEPPTRQRPLERRWMIWAPRTHGSATHRCRSDRGAAGVIAAACRRRTARSRGAGRPTPPLTSTRDIDRAVRAGIARLTGGLAPSALAGAFFDWAVHLAASPGKQFELAGQAITAAVENAKFASRCAQGGAGRSLPLRIAAGQPLSGGGVARVSVQSLCSFLPFDRTMVGGGDDRHPRRQQAARERGRRSRPGSCSTPAAPSNFLLDQSDRARAHGFDMRHEPRARLLEPRRGPVRARSTAKAPLDSDAFKVGETVAVTPGKVVHRTPLAEIIQYAPTTDRVRPEPIVIVPAWIMKYYILDLSPANSLVKLPDRAGLHGVHDLVEESGPTRIATSASTTIVRKASCRRSTAATAITGAKRVHAVGYCLGGTLLAIAAAAMARDHDDRLASLSFLAAQVDFTEAGELMLFINESQVAFLEDMMWERGYLDAKQMSGAFQLLRSNDLIWSRMVQRLSDGRAIGRRSTSWPGTPTPPGCRTGCIRSICGRCSSTTIWPKAVSRSTIGRSPSTIFASRYSRSAPSRTTSRHGARCSRSTSGRCRGHFRADERRAQCRDPVGARSRAPAFPDRPCNGTASDTSIPTAGWRSNPPREGSWWPAWACMDGAKVGRSDCAAATRWE